MAATSTPEAPPTARRVEVPVLWSRAEFRPETYQEGEDGTATIAVRMYAGAVVRRMRLFDEPFDERLSIEPGALRTERLASGRVPFLAVHRRFDLGDVLGVVTGFAVLPEENAIDGTVRLSGREEIASIRRDLKDGILTNVSIGFRVWKFRDVTEKDSEVQQLLAIDWEILELSLVPIGADPGAAVRAEDQDALNTRTTDLGSNPCEILMAQSTKRPARQTEGGQRSTAEAPEQEATRSQTTESDADENEDEATRSTSTSTAPAPAARTSATTSENVALAAQRAVADERRRVATIQTRLRTAGLEVDGDFGRRLVDEGVSVERAAGLILDELAERDAADRTRSVVTVGAEGGDKAVRAVTDAMFYRANLRPLIADTPAEIEKRLQGNPFVHRSLLEIGREFVESVNGVSLRHLSKMELAGAILAARGTPFSSRAAAAHTTTDFPGILANIATKTLRRSYDLQAETFSAWTTTGTLPDFKTAQRVQVGAWPPLKQKVEGAEYEYATFGEQSEPILLATYGRIIRMTREMIVNDDLDAFMRMPRTMGGAARQLEADLVYAHVTGNTVMADGNALFSAAHGNLVTGAGNSLASAGVTALSNVRQLGRQQRTIDPGDGEDQGHLMSVNLRHLRVPEQLETVAQQLTSQIQAQQVGNVNPFQGSFATVAAEPRLGAASAIAFYLFGDPSLIDTIEVAHLQGEEGPVTEQRMGFTTDDLEIKVRHTVGTSPIDFRGSYKNEGTT